MWNSEPQTATVELSGRQHSLSSKGMGAQSPPPPGPPPPPRPSNNHQNLVHLQSAGTIIPLQHAHAHAHLRPLTYKAPHQKLCHECSIRVRYGGLLPVSTGAIWPCTGMCGQAQRAGFTSSDAAVPFSPHCGDAHAVPLWCSPCGYPVVRHTHPVEACIGRPSSCVVLLPPADAVGASRLMQHQHRVEERSIKPRTHLHEAPACIAAQALPLARWRPY